MRRPKSALIAVVVSAAAVSVPVLKAQPSADGRDSRPSSAIGSGSDSPMAAARGARVLLRNGLDYIGYGAHERALELLREAEARQFELSAAERQELHAAIERARQGLRGVATAGQEPADPARRPRPGTIAVAPTRAVPEGLPDGSILLTSAELDPADAAPVEPPGAPAAAPLVADAGPQSSAGPAALPMDPEPMAAPIPPPEALGTAGAPAEPPALPALPAPPEPPPLPELPPEAPLGPARTEPLAPAAPVPAAAAEPALASGLELPAGDLTLPGVPPGAGNEAPLPPPAEELRLESTSTDPPLPLPAPAEAPAPSGAGIVEATPPVPPAATADAMDDRPEPAAPPPINDPQPVAAPSVETTVAGGSGAPPAEPAPAAEPAPEGEANPLLPAEVLRGVEEMARLQREERRDLEDLGGDLGTGAGRESETDLDLGGGFSSPSMVDLGDQDTRIELPRPPSPTQPRPIQAIPVPEEFIPLEPRSWAPRRKVWAAPATCHQPLYFQDAVLERYGQSVEQKIGPHGRYFSYPLDDPTQSRQRNQLLQPFASIGLFAGQVALLPYNLLVDPPWEAEYDLGYYRPGDRIPPDTYYLPLHGVGGRPKGHGHGHDHGH